MAGFFLSAGVAARANTVPFTETFDALNLGPLNGQNSWMATDAEVQDSVTQGSSAKAARLTGQTAYAKQTFNDGQTDVWTDLWVKPVFGAGDASVTTPPAGSTFAFYVHTNGHVVVYDGTTRVEQTHTPLIAGQWVRFTVHSKYGGTPTWDLYLNGDATPLAEGLGFYAPGATAYTEFGVRGAGAMNAYADDVTITLSDPLSLLPRASYVTNRVWFLESVASGVATVTLSPAPTNGVSVDHFLAAGTAVYGEDFTNYTPATLHFTAGETNKSFTFTVMDDADEESDETIVFGIRNVVGALPGAYTNFTWTIGSDPADIPPRVSFLSGSGSSAGAGVVTATVVLTPSQTTTVTVEHAVIGGTAVDGVHYTGYAPGTLTFDPGQTATTFTFTVVGGASETQDKTIVLGLSNFNNASAGAHPTFTHTILSDTNLWYSLPFMETFESRNLGDLDGQRGWVASNAVVQTHVVYAGVKAAELLTLTNSLSHSFTGTHNNVWTDLRVRPVFGYPGQPPAGSTFAFYVETNGHVWAYDGSSKKDLTPPARVLTEGQWVRFTVHSDYANKNWELYVNGLHVGFDFGFFTPGATRYSKFGMQSAGMSNGNFRAYLDNVTIDLTPPPDIDEMLLIIR